MITESAARSAAASRNSSPMDLATMLAGFSVKDRTCFERQLRNCETSPAFGLALRWQRLACAFMGYAPQFPKLTGLHTIQFFIPDGKYRKQVFAMHALPEGVIAICLPDVMDAAQKSLLFVDRHQADDESIYRLRDGGGTIAILQLDGKSINPQPFYKDMTGWNRRAMIIHLPADATRQQVEAVEALSAIAARGWQNAA